MKNIKELVTKFAILTNIKENIIKGEIVLPLSQINDQLAEVSANIIAAINEGNATIVAEAFGGDDQESSFIKASALMVALDEGVALLLK